MTTVQEAQQRIRAQIVADRPAAVAGPAAFWARLLNLPEPLITTALEGLVEAGEVRAQPLGTERFYIADPPHAPKRNS